MRMYSALENKCISYHPNVKAYWKFIIHAYIFLLQGHILDSDLHKQKIKHCTNYGLNIKFLQSYAVDTIQVRIMQKI